MVVERIKKVEGKQKAYCVYIPESYMKHCGWDVETSRFNWCVSEHGLKLVELRRG